MSNNVDRRVVEMQFDNKQFENGIHKSVESLDKLKKGLDLEKSAKGLSAIDKAAEKIDLSRLADAAESVADRFSLMGNLVQNVYRRIGDAALNALAPIKNLINDLTIAPVKTGFSEYETQIDAIQTILSNTRDKMTKQGLSDAERLAIVNDRLNQLNHYADKTIYNFTEMTRNIGTFTAAGVELDTATRSIQGIANLAAISGSTSEQASRAMYQLSQAISTGTVRLLDWNSVVNAGMGGEVFQKSIIRTAKAMGKTVDVTVTETNKAGKKVKKTVKRTIEELIKEEGSFRESLSKGWLTSDILTATLEQFSWDFEQIATDMGYSAENMEEGVLKAMEMKKGELLSKGYTREEAEDIVKLAKEASDAATKVRTFTKLFDALKEAAQSGWTQTWTYIIGDFEEAKKLLTDISDYIGKILIASADARNQVLKGWRELGGRDELIAAFWNIVKTIKNVADAINGEFRKIFPRKTSQQLFDMTKGFRELTDRIRAFTENDEKMAVIRRIIAGMASALDIVRQVVGGIWNAAKQLISYIFPHTESLVEIIAKVADKIREVSQRLRASNGIQKIVEKIVSFMKQMIDGILHFARVVKNTFANGLNAVQPVISEIWAKAKRLINNIFPNTKSLAEVITKIANKIKEIGRGLRESTGFQNISKKSVSFMKQMVNGVSNFASSVKNTFVNGFNAVRPIISEIWVKVKRLIDNISPNTKSLSEVVTKIANKIKEVGQSLRESGGIQKIVEKIVSFMKQMVDGVSNFASAVKNIFSNGAQGFANALKEWFGNFSGIGEKISQFFDENVVLKNIKNFFVNITDGVKKFVSGTKISDITTIIGSILGSGILLKLYKFIGSLTKINKNVAKGVKNVAEGVEDVKKSITNTVDSYKQKKDITKPILRIAASLVLIAGALYIIANIDPNRLSSAIITVGIMLTAIATFTYALSKIKIKKAAGLTGISFGLILLSGAILIFAGAIKKIGKIDDAALVKGIAGLGVVLLELMAFVAITKTAKMSFFKIAGLIPLAIFLKIFANIMQKVGSMDTKTIINGISRLGVILLELAAFLVITKKANLGVSKGIGLIFLAASIKMFVKTIQKIGKIDTKTIKKGISGLGVILLELAAFLALTKKANLDASKGIGLIFMAVSIKTFAKTIQKIGRIDTKTIVKGVSGLGVILLELAAFMAISRKANLDASKGIGLIFMAVSIKMFAKTIQKIGRIDTKTIVKGISGLGIILLELAAFMAISRKADPSISKEAALIVLAVSINMFADVIAKIGNIDTGSMVKGIIGLGAVLLELAIFMTMVKKIKFSMSIGAGMILMALALNGFAEAIARIGKLKTKTIVKGVSGLGLVMLELSMFMRAISKTKTRGITKSILMLGVMAVSMYIFAEVLKQLEGVKLSTMTGFSVSFGAAILSLSGSMMLISKVPVTAVIGGIAKLGLIAAAIVALFAVFGAAEQSLKLTSYIDSFGALAESIGRATGRFIGGIGSGITEGVNLPRIGTDLSNFMTNIQPFLDGCKGVDESVKVGVGNLASAMVAIGGGEFVTAVVAWVTGDNPIIKFSDDIGTIAIALNNFATNLSGFSETNNTKITSVVNAAKGLAELVRAVPWDAPQWVQAFAGGRNVEKFANDSGPLAAALLNYSKSIRGFSETSPRDITNSVDAARALAELAKTLPKEGGWMQSILGQKKLGEFGTKAALLGSGLASFASNIGDVSKEETTNALEVMGLITEFTSGLNTEGGIFNAIGNLFGGTQDIVGLSEKMATVGTNLSTFAAKIGTADFSNTEQATKLMTEMQEYIGSLTKTGGVWSGIGEWFGGSKDIVGFSVKMASFADNFSTFASGITGAKQAMTDFTSVKTILNEFTSLASSVENQNIDTDKMSKVATGVGLAFVNSLAAAISGGSGTIGAASISLAKSGADNAKCTYIFWFNTGKNLALGLANGITAMIYRVKNSAMGVAFGAIRAIATIWLVHSPSRVGYDLGMNFDLGIAGGLNQYSRVVSQSAESIGKDAVDSARTMLRDTDYSIFDFIDSTPTIRPVLDLSNVRDGVGAIDGMLNPERITNSGLFQGINFRSGMNELKFDGPKISGGANNKDVVSELQMLSSRFDQLNDAVTNMKIVLDSGELVGATSGKMDGQLGTIAMRRGRGN